MNGDLTSLIRVCDTVDAAQARPLTERVRQVYRDQGMPLDEQVLGDAMQQETVAQAIAVAPAARSAREGYWWAIRQAVLPALILGIPLSLMGLGFWAGVSTGKAMSQPPAWGQTVTYSISTEDMPPEMCQKVVKAYQDNHAIVRLDGELATSTSCNHHPHLLAASLVAFLPQ